VPSSEFIVDVYFRLACKAGASISSFHIPS
jgi:hypothetical protein